MKVEFTLYSTPLIKINSLSQPKKYKVYISFEQPKSRAHRPLPPIA